MRRPVAILGVLVALASCGHATLDIGKPTAHVTFSGDATKAALKVVVADTPAERQEGLSGIKTLPTGSGAAFVFAQPSTDTFWMKDTLIPLAVAFVGADGTIIAIREMTPCTADPCPTYASPEPYTLAIEAAPGWYTANHVVAGGSAALEDGAS